MDGGFADNLPIAAAYEEGCNVIFPIHLNRTTLINKAQFPGTKILEILPQQHLGSFFKGTIDFSREGVRRLLKQGYDDGMRIVEPVVNMMKIQVSSLKTLSHLK